MTSGPPTPPASPPNLQFPQISEPFVDPATGLLTRPWIQFLRGLYLALGGTQPVDTAGLLQYIFVTNTTNLSAQIESEDTQAQAVAGQLSLPVPSSSPDGLVQSLLLTLSDQAQRVDALEHQLSLVRRSLDQGQSLVPGLAQRQSLRLGDLSDVLIAAAPTNGQKLTFNSTLKAWEPV